MGLRHTWISVNIHSLSMPVTYIQMVQNKNRHIHTQTHTQNKCGKNVHSCWIQVKDIWVFILLYFQLFCMFELLKRRKDISSLPIYFEVKLPEFRFQLHHYWPNDCRQFSKPQLFNLEDAGSNNPWTQCLVSSKPSVNASCYYYYYYSSNWTAWKLRPERFCKHWLFIH